MSDGGSIPDDANIRVQRLNPLADELPRLKRAERSPKRVRCVDQQQWHCHERNDKESERFHQQFRPLGLRLEPGTLTV